MLDGHMEFAPREWHGDMPWDISERHAARLGCGLSLNQVHFFGGSESQGVQVPEQPVSWAAPLPAATRPPRALDVAEHSARALVTHPTARGAAVTPQAAGRASKTHPRSEGARTPAGPSAAATAAADGRPARNGRTDGADLRVIRSAAASHHAPHPPDMHPAVITSEQAAPTTQRRKGPQRPHPRPRRRLYAAARSRATDAGLHVPPERRRQPTRPATPPDTHPTARLGASAGASRPRPWC